MAPQPGYVRRIQGPEGTRLVFAVGTPPYWVPAGGSEADADGEGRGGEDSGVAATGAAGQQRIGGRDAGAAGGETRHQQEDSTAI